MNESKCGGVRKKLVVVTGLEVVGWMGVGKVGEEFFFILAVGTTALALTPASRRNKLLPPPSERARDLPRLRDHHHDAPMNRSQSCQTLCGGSTDSLHTPRRRARRLRDTIPTHQPLDGAIQRQGPVPCLRGPGWSHGHRHCRSYHRTLLPQASPRPRGYLMADLADGQPAAASIMARTRCRCWHR
jgi:hypothetical protein